MANGRTIQVTWTNVIGSLMAGMLLAGAAWTLFQSQLTSIKEEVSQVRRDGLASDRVLRSDIVDIRGELRSRRSEFPSQFQFEEFKYHMTNPRRMSVDEFNQWRMERDKLIDAMSKRIDRLEDTKGAPARPQP